MTELNSHKTIDLSAPASEVWALISDFGRLDKIWPAGTLEKVDIEGEGVGMIRHLHTIVGMVLSERLDSIDPEQMQLRLSITGDLPVGMHDYSAHGQVISTGPESCRVEWSGRYNVPSAKDEEDARNFIEGAYGAMFAGLQGYLAKRA